MSETIELCRRLLSASQRIADSATLEEGLSAVCAAVMGLVHPRAVAIALAGDGREAFKIVSSRGLSASYINHHALPADDPGVERVIVGREDVAVVGIGDDRPEATALRMENTSGSLLATPVVAMNRAVGLLIVTSDKEAAFDEEATLLVRLAARMAAACHDRSALYEERRHWRAVDPQTGLWSFEFFSSRMREEIARSRRQSTHLSLAHVDIDRYLHYKQVHGSQAADGLFVRVVETIRGTLRGIDVMGRYGVDEVLVALPETDLQGAIVAGQRIREAVEGAAIAHGHGGAEVVTVSVGVARLHDDEEGAGPIIERAQRTAYQATLRGGNTVCDEGVL